MEKVRKVLLVEDEAIAVMTMEDILGEWGHEVCGIVSTAADAVVCAREKSPDIILMDI
ncbi:MAG: response regulator, partial [Bacteroides sp.]|nr:response regulator [Bacteroides sp.]